MLGPEIENPSSLGRYHYYYFLRMMVGIERGGGGGLAPSRSTEKYTTVVGQEADKEEVKTGFQKFISFSPRRRFVFKPKYRANILYLF